jgi:hypothetical protein
MYPGINKLCFDNSNWPATCVNLNDLTDAAQAKVFGWLESVLWIVEIPFVSRPEDYNSQRINKLKDATVPKEDKVRMVKALADASERAWAGIVSMDSDALGQALSDTMTAWGEMLPYTVDPYLGDDEEKSRQLRDFCGHYDRPHTKGALFSGAGGGFLMVISDTPVEGGTQIKINHDPLCKPFPSHNLSSTPSPLPPC